MVTPPPTLDVAAFFFLWSYKIATLLVGCFFAGLGYALFRQGATGEFTFGMEFKGAKTSLMSASPGLFLILMGTIIVSVGLYQGLDFEITRTPAPAPRVVEYPNPELAPTVPPLPSMPEPKE